MKIWGKAQALNGRTLNRREKERERDSQNRELITRLSAGFSLRNTVINS